MIFNFFVGRGTGPLIVIPDLFAIAFIDSQIRLIASMSVLFNFTRAFDIVLIEFEFGLKTFLYLFSFIKVKEKEVKCQKLFL